MSEPLPPCSVLQAAGDSPTPVAEGVSRREFLACAASCAPLLFGEAGAQAAQGPAPVSARPKGRPGAMPLRLRVNGEEHLLAVDPRTTLLDALREHLQLVGTKKGCDHGQCGACTVLIEGRRSCSCLTLAVMHEGATLTTIEGLRGAGDALHPMQAAFLACDALQCGFCTPGQIVSAVGLLSEPCGPEDGDVREAMSGNLCRCGAYPNIITAVQSLRRKEG